MPDEVMSTLARMEQSYRAKVEPKQKLKPEPLKEKQLPFWPETDRAAPSAVLRSALFRVTQRKKRGWFSEQTVASWEGDTITYHGEELMQDDLDVWLQILHMARGQQSNRVVFTGRGMLKLLGRKGTGQRDLRWLDQCLTRLTTNTLTISSNGEDRPTYQGPILYERVTSPSRKDHIAVINPRIANLFDDGYTRFGWAARRSLKGDLTRWLHGYVSSHKATFNNPSRIGLERLQELCGSEMDGLRFFKREVRKAMQRLEDKCVVMQWGITNDVLTFSRPPRRQNALTEG